MKNSFKKLAVVFLIFCLAAGASSLPLGVNKAGAQADDTVREKEAFKACEKAAELSSKLGALTSLNVLIDPQKFIGDALLGKAQDFLGQEIKNTTGINFNPRQAVSNAVGGVRSFLADKFSDFLTNPLKSQIQDQIDKIKGELTNRIAGEIEEDAKTKITSLFGTFLNDEVPTRDQQAVTKAEEASRKQIKELKREQYLANTRQRCGDLLKTTVATIKRALLYQLSTQIVDWVQNGGKLSDIRNIPFIKQPGKVPGRNGKTRS